MKVISRAQIMRHIRKPLPAKAGRVIDENKKAYNRRGKYPNDYMAEMVAEEAEELAELDEMLAHIEQWGPTETTTLTITLRKCLESDQAGVYAVVLLCILNLAVRF
jgi:hypothetical protein